MKKAGLQDRLPIGWSLLWKVLKANSGLFVVRESK